MGDTKIEWADKTWNPVTGCKKVSPGCANCYAEQVAKRFWKDRAFTDVEVHKDRLAQPLKWRKPVRIFVNSMSDLFHEDVHDSFIDAVFAVMAMADQHTFQVLTKRPERMREYLSQPDCWEHWRDPAVAISESPCAAGLIEDRDWPLPNVHLGVSAEDQQRYDERAAELRRTPAAVRFVSAEPLLSRIDIGTQFAWPWFCLRHGVVPQRDAETHLHCHDDGEVVERRIDWIIVGGESGRGSRVCRAEWVRTIVCDGRALGVPIFVKQLGANSDWRVPNVWRAMTGPSAIECEHGYDACPQCDTGDGPMLHPKGGDVNEWPTDLRVQQWPAT